MDHPAQPMRSADQQHYRGTRQRKNGKWVAEICINGKNKWLGTYATAEEAARAYDKEAIALRKIHAKLNFPKQSTPKFDASSSHESSTSQNLKQPQLVPEAFFDEAQHSRMTLQPQPPSPVESTATARMDAPEHGEVQTNAYFGGVPDYAELSHVCFTPSPPWNDLYPYSDFLPLPELQDQWDDADVHRQENRTEPGLFIFLSFVLVSFSKSQN